jgi:hypothetical protein
MLFKELFTWLSLFECSQKESFLFEPANDLSNKSSLDSVGLDHNVCSFVSHCWYLYYNYIFKNIFFFNMPIFIIN